MQKEFQKPRQKVGESLGTCMQDSIIIVNRANRTGSINILGLRQVFLVASDTFDVLDISEFLR